MWDRGDTHVFESDTVDSFVFTQMGVYSSRPEDKIASQCSVRLSHGVLQRVAAVGYV